MFRFLYRLALYGGALALFGLLVAAGGVLAAITYYGADLPDHQQLVDYSPPVVTRLHAGDGQLVAEYAVENRVFVPIEGIPSRVRNAFIAAEDQRFYTHPGIDPFSIARAALENLSQLGTNRRPVGASTITQQVAKNFLLTSDVSFERKIKEAILAVRIEHALDKDRILELYLNEIYLGFNSYGVGSAALNYFGKALDELTIAEAAFLAALPKAPSNYHPVRQPDNARIRRDWVVGRMLAEGFISTQEAEIARSAPVTLREPPDTEDLPDADYFAEEVRRFLISRYGDQALYGGGLSVRTTVDPRLQAIAERSLRAGLIAYDRRHGWRGPVGRIETGEGWPSRLARVPAPGGLEPWRLAVVLTVGENGVDIGLADGTESRVPMSEMTWARAWREGQGVGPEVRRPADVVAVGDVIPVELVTTARDGSELETPHYALRQIPAVDGALVALDPHTGRVRAMVGGYAFSRSSFNRATQARRQPGSSFKPFVYLAAMENGYTPSSIVLDAPFAYDPGPGQETWRPSNYSNEFYGPSTLRTGIEKSRNVMTVRLAEAIGMESVARTAEAFGIFSHMPRQLAMSLGAGETTVLQLTAAYAMLVNGGLKIEPRLIDRIQDRHGATVLRHDTRPCVACSGIAWTDGQDIPRLPDDRERLVPASSAYQVVSMLQGAVERGTGATIGELGIPLAGKTGTTNESRDAWFVGFAPDLAVGVFVGFDRPQPLGARETGGSVAAPVFKSFMQAALADQPAVPFRVPTGIRLVRVDPDTGRLAGPGDRRTILEAFKPGTEPSTASAGRQQLPGLIAPASGGGSGGLY